jgi:hypothetical protein
LGVTIPEAFLLRAGEGIERGREFIALLGGAALVTDNYAVTQAGWPSKIIAQNPLKGRRDTVSSNSQVKDGSASDYCPSLADFGSVRDCSPMGYAFPDNLG